MKNARHVALLLLTGASVLAGSAWAQNAAPPAATPPAAPATTAPATAATPPAAPATAAPAPAMPAHAMPAGQTAPAPGTRMPSPKDAYVYIGWPVNGTVIHSTRFKIWFGTRNFGVAPAGRSFRTPGIIIC